MGSKQWGFGTAYSNPSYPDEFIYFPIQFTEKLYGVWSNLPFMAVDWSIRANFYDISDTAKYHLNLLGCTLDHAGSNSYEVSANWFAMGI